MALWAQVYPRVCGGTYGKSRIQVRISGLSPRVRGNRRRCRCRHGPIGSIPACAGEPTGAHDAATYLRVYPRVCGGTRNRRRDIRHGLGLSPRVRGNRRRCKCRHGPTRSIPACAGEPTGAHDAATYLRVYPRVCGGTRNRRRDIRHGLGLSPRVRGNPMGYLGNLRSQRSIPACAGEPRGWQTRLLLLRVYPRVCGGTWGQCVCRPCC